MPETRQTFHQQLEDMRRRHAPQAVRPDGADGG